MDGWIDRSLIIMVIDDKKMVRASSFLIDLVDAIVAVFFTLWQIGMSAGLGQASVQAYKRYVL